MGYNYSYPTYNSKKPLIPIPQLGIPSRTYLYHSKRPVVWTNREAAPSSSNIPHKAEKSGVAKP